MTLYYSLVFLLLVAEMVIFMGLVMPLPFTIKRKLFTFVSESPLIAKLQYGLKITFIFILILFVDSVNRVYRVQLEASAAHKNQNAEVMGGSARSDYQARKFYAQRNMYLCGFTLFLSLILNRTYVMILDTLRLEEEVKRLSGDKSAGGKDSAKLAQAGDLGEISKLKKKLAEKERDIEILKKQGDGFQQEYNRLSDHKLATSATEPKKDA